MLVILWQMSGANLQNARLIELLPQVRLDPDLYTYRWLLLNDPEIELDSYQLFE